MKTSRFREEQIIKAIKEARWAARSRTPAAPSACPRQPSTPCAGSTAASTCSRGTGRARGPDFAGRDPDARACEQGTLAFSRPGKPEDSANPATHTWLEEKSRF